MSNPHFPNPHFTNADGFKSIVAQTRRIQEMQEEIRIILGLILKFLNEGSEGPRNFEGQTHLGTYFSWRLHLRPGLETAYDFVLVRTGRGDGPFDVIADKWEIAMTPRGKSRQLDNIGSRMENRGVREARKFRIPSGMTSTLYYHLTALLNGIHAMWPDEFGQFLDELRDDAEYVPSFVSDSGTSKK